MATSYIENSIIYNDEKGNDKTVSQSVTMNTNESELFSIITADKKIISINKNSGDGNLTFKFAKENFDIFDFGQEFEKTHLHSILTSKEFVLNSKNSSSPVSLTESTKNQELVFSISPLDEDGKKITITVNALSMSIEYEGKKYQGNFNSKNYTKEELDKLSNNFIISKTFFEKLVDNQDYDIKTLSPKRIPSYLIGQYFELAEKSEDLKINNSQLGNINFIHYNMNGQKYCFVKDSKKDELFIYHSGSLSKIDKKEIKLYKDGDNYFLFASLPGAKYISLPLPKDESIGRNFLKNFNNDIALISSPRSRAKSSYAGYACVQKDERDATNYNFSIKSKSIRLHKEYEEKKEKEIKEKDKIKEPEIIEDKPSQQKEEEEKKKAENTKKKFDTKFLGETAMPLLGFAFLVISALTGGLAFSILAVAAMAASVGFIYLDGKELNIYRTIKKFEDNKYTKFREQDHECGKAKENYKEKYHEMQKFVQAAKDTDFAPNFFKYYDQYGISSESNNLAEKYELATNKTPTQEMMEKFAEIQTVQDEKEKAKLKQEFIASLPESEKEVVEKEFAQSSFLDLNHAEVQREAYNDLVKITSETNPSIKAQLKTQFIEKFMPNLDTVLPIQFANEFSNINDSNKTSRVEQIVEKYYPNLTGKEKAAKIADISMIADIAIDKSITPQTKKAKIHDYISKNKIELKENMVNQIIVDCFGKEDENKDNVRQFNDNLIALSSSALKYTDKKDSASALIRKDDPTFLYNLFYYEKDEMRKKHIIDEYSDAIAQKFIYNKTDSQIAFDKFIQLLPENLRDYATARFKFSCIKIDNKMGHLHQDIYTAVKDIEKIEDIENIAKAIYQSNNLFNKRSFNDLVTDLPEKYYDAMLLSDCRLDKKTDLLISYSFKDDLKIASREFNGKDYDITLSDLIQMPVNTQKVKDAFLDYQMELKSSNILVDLSQSFISRDNKTPFSNINLVSDVSPNLVSTENGKKTDNLSFSKTVDEYIKNAFIRRFIELERQGVYEKDFDKAVFDERALKEKLSKLSLTQLKNKIDTEYPDKSVFYGEDESLPQLMNLLEKKLKLNKELDESTTFAKFDKQFSTNSSSVTKKGKNLIVTDTSYFGKKKTGEVIAIIDENGKIEIKNKDLDKMMKNYPSMHEGLNFHEYINSLSISEKACLIKLLHLQMLLTQAYIKAPEINLDAKKRADVIDLIISGKVSGSLNEEFIKELTRQNADILVNDNDIKTKCKNAKNNYNDRYENGFEDVASMAEKDYFDYEKACSPVQEILDLLPVNIKINVFNKMRKKRDFYKEDSGVRLLLMTLKEEIEGNEELKTLLESKLNGKKFTDLTDEKVLKELLEATSKEKEEKIEKANRAYSTSTEDLSNGMVSSEVKHQSKAMKKHKYLSQSLESEENISNLDNKLEEKEQELLVLRQIQSKFLSLIAKIKKYLGNEKEINDYKNFSELLKKILSGDETTLKLLGIEKEELNLVIEYMNENNIVKKDLLENYLKKYDSKNSSLAKSKKTLPEKTISLNKAMKKEWGKLEKEIDLKFKEKEEKIKEEKDKVYNKAVKKDKLKKNKEGNKVRKSARWFIKRKNKEKLEKDKEVITEITEDKDKGKESVADKESPLKKDSEKD